MAIECQSELLANIQAFADAEYGHAFDRIVVSSGEFNVGRRMEPGICVSPQIGDDNSPSKRRYGIYVKPDCDFDDVRPLLDDVLRRLSLESAKNGN